jgi:hypothetical protein
MYRTTSKQGVFVVRGITLLWYAPAGPCFTHDDIECIVHHEPDFNEMSYGYFVVVEPYHSNFILLPNIKGFKN